MAETYSLAVTAVKAHQPQFVKAVILPDSHATNGGQSNAMQTGLQLLCKNPDGSFANYVLDAERSTPSNPVLLATRP